MSKTLISNAIIVNEGKKFRGYLLTDGGFISRIGEGDAPAEISDESDLTIDADGAYLLPGAIDTHAHFREPGLTHKATIASESATAVAGGVTSFLEMPNTKPATVSESAVAEKKRIAAETSFANYGFFIGATNDNIDDLLKADYTTMPGIKLFMGSSTGNMLVDRDSTLRRLFAEFRGVIAVHAEDEATIRANREWLAKELGEKPAVEIHSLLRSREACIKATRRAIDLAKANDTRLHLLHISTAEEAEMLSKGVISDKKITAETCPHYLIFTAADLAKPRGYVRKCNPAIKGEDDRRALLNAVADNRIDIIATDHAPHLLKEKEGSLFTAASGMPGVKFMLPLMIDLTVGDDPRLTIEQVVEKTAHNPATLYAIDRRGFIREGYHADLVVARCGDDCSRAITDADSTDHLPEGIERGCRWTPYAGTECRTKIMLTMVNGEIAFNGSKCTGRRNAMPLAFNRK